MHTCINVQMILGIRQLAAVGAHGRRSQKNVLDHVNLLRTPTNIAASNYAADALDLVTAFKNYTATCGAVRYGSAPIAAHVLVSVSPELVAEGGDPHDPDNPVNRLLFQQGSNWANSTFGTGSVIAARMDCDEAGSGVLDVIVVPVRTKTVNRYASKTLISVSSALEDVRKAHGERKSFSALQTSWALHAQRTIDERLLRGTPREITQRFHVEHSIFRPLAEAYAHKRKNEEDIHLERISEDLKEIEDARHNFRLALSDLVATSDQLKQKGAKLERQERKTANLGKALSFCVQAYTKNLFVVSADDCSVFELTQEVTGAMREKLLLALEEGKQAGFSVSFVSSLERNVQLRAPEIELRGNLKPG